MRARAIAAAFLCSCALGTAAAADGSDRDPVAVVRAFYARDSIRAYEFYSARLKALFIADERAGEPGSLDFAFHCNCQDASEGWQLTLRYELVPLSAPERERALVRVTFTNFGRPHEIRYTLVREGGRWLIDDARSIEPDRWLLSTILDAPR